MSRGEEKYRGEGQEVEAADDLIRKQEDYGAAEAGDGTIESFLNEAQSDHFKKEEKYRQEKMGPEGGEAGS